MSRTVCTLKRLGILVDRRCARLNSGLAAVAIVLAGMVLATAIGRLQSYREPGAVIEFYAGVIGNPKLASSWAVAP